jgi:cysteine desulfurase
MSQPQPLYLDASATSPPADEVLEVMQAVYRSAWGNPSSLHGFGLAAAEQLERSRQELAAMLGADAEELLFSSGGSESIHLAIHGVCSRCPPGRLLLSAVEHPATLAAAALLQQRGWQVELVPVDGAGLLDIDRLEALLEPPTRLLSLIWGQSEVGSLQNIEAIGARCRSAGVLLHLDAVQVVGHQPVDFRSLPVDLLSFTAHKLQGPRGIGGLLVRAGLELDALIGGGGQERGRRGGTEAVALVAGMAAALKLATARLLANNGSDPLAPLRDNLLTRLLELPGLRLSGPDPRAGEPRLPHHLSLLVNDRSGQPLSGRQLVRALWREGVAASSGSACSSGRARATASGAAPSAAASPVLEAMGYGSAEAASGLRFSLGPWLQSQDLDGVPAALERARQQLMENSSS